MRLLGTSRTPFVVRTGSGNFQAWYRHSGEHRKIRPWGNALPIDQLGDGYVVAPPSEGRRCSYRIIEGTFDDLTALPVMRNPWTTESAAGRTPVGEGSRNDKLWRHCMRDVRYCDSFDELLDVARTYNDDACVPPLPDDEVIKAATSAWSYEHKGDNWFGRHGSWLTTESVDAMIHDPYFTALIAWLQSRNGPDARFWVADGLAAKFGWPRRKLTGARKKAIETKWIVPLNKPAQGRPGEYRWGPARKQRQAG